VYRVAVVLSLVAGALAGCGKRDAAPAGPEIAELSIEPANAPRQPPVLVAGEPARVGLRIRGGRPPYRIRLSSEPLHGELSAAPAAADAAGVDAALRVEIERDAAAGSHSVTATVTDADGAVAEARRPLQLAGRGSPETPAPGAPPWLAGEDVAGRRRADLYRGEAVTLRGRLAEPGPYRLELTDPDGARVAQTGGVAEDAAIGLPFEIPRLARPGRYRLSLSADAGGEPLAAAEFRVAGEPYPAVSALTVDELGIYGGADRRSDRKALLRRGETVRVELRVGGAREQVAATLRLRDRAGAIAATAPIGTARPASQARDARLMVGGDWSVPTSLAPGRYRLEAEASEGDDLSAVYREVQLE